jgi:hypothetical protein
MPETRNNFIPYFPNKRVLGTALFLALLAGCGGGGGSSGTSPTTGTNNGNNGNSGGTNAGSSACTHCSAGTIVGTAAAGAPIESGSIHLVDAQGALRTGALNADGTYSIDVSGLVAPFVIKVAGFAGGQPVELHTVATSEDVGQNAVNVTPLTELVAAYAVGQDPAAYMSNPNNAGKLTKDALTQANQLVSNQVKSVTDSLGVTVADFRNTEFATDRAGADKLLDALQVSSRHDPASGKIQYTIALTGGTASIDVQPDQPGSAKLAADSAAVQAASNAIGRLAEIDARLADLAKLFVGGLPTSAAVQSFFATDGFLHDGLDFNGFAQTYLLQPAADAGSADFKDVSFGRTVLEQVVDDSHIVVSFEVKPSANLRPWRLVMHALKRNGVWLFNGDHELVDARVYFMARLSPVPLTEAQVQALPGVSSYIDNGLVNYSQQIPGTTDQRWLGGPLSYADFGVIGWGPGGTFDNPSTTGVNERAQQVATSQYYATPSGRVRTYLMFDISSTHAAANIAQVHITGPGLPAAGLDMVRPGAGSASQSNFNFKGDASSWWAFDSERCPEMARAPSSADNGKPVIADCGLDWTKIDNGADYQFALLDSTGATIATITRRMLGHPRTPDKLYTAREALFPRFDLASTYYTLANVRSDVAGSDFASGGTIHLRWKLPTDPTVTTWIVSSNRLVWLNNDGSNTANQRRPAALTTLAGKLGTDGKPLTTAAHSFAADGLLTDWAWSNIRATDTWGNEYQHEVSPLNPY